MRIGDRVICREGYDGNSNIRDKVGTVIVVHSGSTTCTVLFDESIGGWGIDELTTYERNGCKPIIEGRDICKLDCWNILGGHIKLVDFTPRRSIKKHCMV